MAVCATCCQHFSFYLQRPCKSISQSTGVLKGNKSKFYTTFLLYMMRVRLTGISNSVLWEGLVFRLLATLNTLVLE